MSAAAFHNPGADTEVEEVYFTKNAGEPLHGHLSEFSASREQWHSRWMKAGICRSWLLCLEEHGFYLMLLKCMATRVMGNPERFPSKIVQKALAMAHVCGGQLKKELAVGGTFAPEPEELPYFHAVLKHVRAIVDLEYRFHVDWTVIKYPTQLGRFANRAKSKPDMFVGTLRFL